MSQIIFALDVSTEEEALYFVDLLKDHVSMFKIGLELFINCGLDTVRKVSERAPVFLDLKLHDIPNTVIRSINALKDLNVEYLTVFMDNNISRVVKDVSTNIKLLTVHVLTSSGMGPGAAAIIKTGILISKFSGVAGSICPGSELKEARKLVGNDFLLITPGIRLASDSAHDQANIITPKRAILDGANKIVVGRSIRLAQDPVSVAKQINNQIQEALEEVSSDAE